MTLDKKNRRFYLAGYRIHHGAFGVLLAFIGAALMAHDWRDLASWRPRRER